MTTTMDQHRLRGTLRAGQVCLAAGLLGMVQGIWLAAVPANVPADRWSYPLAGAAYTFAQVSFFVQHVGLLAGVRVLGRGTGTDTSAVGRWGVGIASGGLVVLAVTELVAVAAEPEPVTGVWATALNAIYGAGSLLIGVGMVLAGVAVRRSGTWSGWRRWLPLAVGAYVFVPLVPALAGPFTVARYVLVGWFALWALLGWALARPANATA